MKIIALDQSSKVTGYSIFEKGNLIKYGTLEANPKEKDNTKRMHEMKCKVADLIKNNSPDVIVIENVQFQTNQQVYSVLSMLKGMLIGLFYDLGMAFEVVEASVWKNFLSIKGKKREEQKKNTQQFVRDKYGVDADEDTADSIGIGTWAINKL